MDFANIRQNFERHGFETQLFQNKEEVRAYLSEKLSNQTVGFGGSETLEEIGLYETLRQNNVVIWHNKVPGVTVRKLANNASIYITSANAVTKNGEILNIDGTGNRVAMTSFGPQTCYYIIGKNKITDDIKSAYDRCKNIAAPLNAKRLKAKTPCAVKADKCYDCNSPYRICRIINIIERAPFGMQCEIIFVNQDLGY